MFVLKSTHTRLIQEEVLRSQMALDEMRAKLAVFKAEIVEQAAVENVNLQRKIVELQNIIAAQNSRLVHDMANPEDAVVSSQSLALK
jgi:hypothetical protein